MTRRFVVRPQADLEIAEAAEWYFERARGLASEFVRVVDAAFATIERNPLQFPLVDGRPDRLNMQDHTSVAIAFNRLGNIAVLAVACGVAYSLISALIRRAKGVRAAWLFCGFTTLLLVSVGVLRVQFGWPELAGWPLVLYMSLAMFGIPLASCTFGIVRFSRRSNRGVAALTAVGFACFALGIIPGVIMAVIPDFLTFMQAQGD